jgi:LPS sulfotransferase NodH
MTSISDIFPDFDNVLSGEISTVCQKPTLILAITARTGSTQLCSVLESMSVFSTPTEILNARGVVQNIVQRTGAKSFVDYLDKLTNTDTPYFAFKTSWSDFAPLSQAYRSIFPKVQFIFLDRFDVVAQAISLYKAMETGQWHSLTSAKYDVTNLSAEQIDVSRVQSLMKTLMDEKLQWERFFFSNELFVRHLYYEIIKDDWITAAKLIAEQFGHNGTTASGGKFARLSGESDQALIDHFKKTHGYSWISI